MLTFRLPDTEVTEGDSKYSVTAYFPRRFKDLRAKCGLTESLCVSLELRTRIELRADLMPCNNDRFIESLSRCTDLNPSGGKSSAAFLMTGNQRFMLKELVGLFDLHYHRALVAYVFL